VFAFLSSDEEKVGLYFQTLCDFSTLERLKLNLREKTFFMRFLVGSFQSLSASKVRMELLKLTHLPLWKAVSIPKRTLALARAPKSVQKQYLVLSKQEAKGKDFSREAQFVPSVLQAFLFASLSKKKLSAEAELLVQRSVEWMIDLLAQLPTRRYFKMYFEDVLVLARLKTSAIVFSPKTQKLIAMLRYYAEFEVDEFTGAALSAEEVALAHAARLGQLQEHAYQSAEGNEHLIKFAIANVAAIGSRYNLEKMLKPLDEATVRQLAQSVGIGGDYPLSVIREGLLLFCQARNSQVESINRIPLYPTETLLWDEALIPAENYSGQTPLPLPKLTLQYLTFYDYLLRNYNLFRLEAAYELRQDVNNVITRMNPSALTDGSVKFQGWARQALPIRSAKILTVSEPLLGDSKPAQVKLEVM
jgi:intron-binding protein aquarius